MPENVFKGFIHVYIGIEVLPGGKYGLKKMLMKAAHKIYIHPFPQLFLPACPFQ